MKALGRGGVEGQRTVGLLFVVVVVVVKLLQQKSPS